MAGAEKQTMDEERVKRGANARYGLNAEQALRDALKNIGIPTSYDRALDMGDHKIDILTPAGYGGKHHLRRVPGEIQTTLAVDDSQKMRLFLNAPAYIIRPRPLRIYVEGWFDKKLGVTANLIKRLLEEAADSLSSPEPVFLRIGPRGSITNSLRPRLQKVTELEDDNHPKRVRGIIVGVDKTLVLVKLARGRVVKIPTRCFLDAGMRSLIRTKTVELLQRGDYARTISFLPGRCDESGLEVFMAKRVLIP